MKCLNQCSIIMVGYKLLSFILLYQTSVSAQMYYPGEERCLTPSKQPGKCVTINNCDGFFERVKKITKKTDIFNELSNFKCGYERLKLKICCPMDHRSIHEENITPNSIDNTKISNRRKKSDLLPTNCGVLSNGVRIIDGEDVNLMEFPWMALISYQEQSPSYRCGGTIINSRYILTAAHCLSSKQIKLKSISVRVGEHDINTALDCTTVQNVKKCAPPVQNLKIDEIIIHPSFNRNNAQNDIALMRTATAIDLTRDNAKAVCLPQSNTDVSSSAIGLIAGWGTMTSGGTLNNKLLKELITVLPQESCNDIFRKFNLRQPLNNQQLCMNGKDCNGDSGGPFFTPERFNKLGYRYVQQGIISFGLNPCGKYPSVLTKVSSYMDWILETIRP